MKLVYIDDAGGVASVPINTDYAVLKIDRSIALELDSDIVNTEEIAEPLALPSESNGIPFFVWRIISVLAAMVLALTVIILVLRKKRPEEKTKNSEDSREKNPE
jgi:hypothetical protein